MHSLHFKLIMLREQVDCGSLKTLFFWRDSGFSVLQKKKKCVSVCVCSLGH